MATPLALLDTDMLSEVMRDRDAHVREAANRYLAEHGRLRIRLSCAPARSTPPSTSRERW